jgi:acetylornithine deacetylase/succinyl-diaminopimelate desuccinylase-like protein
MHNDYDRHLETARTGDPVALAQLLVATPSVNPSLSVRQDPETEGEGRIAAVTAELLRGWGFEVETPEVAPGRPNVVARLAGSADATLLLNGHLDTVGVEGMTIPPFAAQILGSRLLGRGACDMKGGVAALLAAVRRLARAGPRPNLVVLLAEVEADLAVVCEPTSLAVMPAHKGFVWVTAVFEGRAAHGSLPAEGIDAIRHAALFVSELDRYTAALEHRAPHPLLAFGSIHTGTIAGGTAPSVYPDRCEVQLECRTMPGTRADEVLAELGMILDDVRRREPALRGSLQVALARPGTEVATDSRVVTGLLGACRAHRLRADVRGMTAWVDAAYLNEAGTPAVCFGPGSTAQAHTADEWIETGEIRSCAEVLETFARSLVGRSLESGVE